MLADWLIYILILLVGLVSGGYLQRRRTSKALREELEEAMLYKDRYELLTENIAACIIIRNRDNQILFCSPFSEVLTGYSTQEIYRMQPDFFKSIAFEDDRASIDRAMKVAAYGEAFQYRHRFYHKTGILMWAETRTVPIMDSNGEVTASLSITLDVTGSVLYQKQVEDKNRDLQDFTYMISHDLKAPIYTIKGMHGILNESLTGDLVNAEAKEAITHIDLALNRLENLVNSVIDYSKVTAQELSSEPIQFPEVLGEVLKDFEPLILKTGAEIKTGPYFPVILSNRTALYQILSNLIGNAIKYRSEERRLLIEITADETQKQKYCTICIRDNGQGIAEDKLPGIFRPFQRANTKVEGSGIGLASVKKMVEKTGGQIQVESKEGRGTAFLLKLRVA